MENDRAQYCVMCGTELNEFSGVFGSEQRHKNQKFIPFCRKCQQEYFDMLAKETTPHLAMFYCCIAFDVPFVFKRLPCLDDEAEPWIAYLCLLYTSDAADE